MGKKDNKTILQNFINKKLGTDSKSAPKTKVQFH